ncbi:granulocyte colony-stimulating factor [Ambystoma mexicanum]|uniref:granulocyte colony-stimulating factor n=1 Tax=Ambystoma mexicanum TaxID=8296 RepID=UPI0037E7B33F
MPSIHNVLQMSCLCLLFHCLFVGVSAAPLAEFSGQYGHLSSDQTFQQFLTNNLEFIAKIKDKSQGLRKIFCQELSLCQEDELAVLKEQLRLYPATLDQCQSSSYNLENCFNQVQSGLQTYHSLFSVVEKVLSGRALIVSHLRHDIEDLQSNFRQQMEQLSIVPVNYPAAEVSFPSTFHEQAGGYLIVCNLQHSMETLIRALRALLRQ